MARVDIRGLCKTYEQEDGTPLEVLRDMAIRVEEGEFVCILGPSGCGKSTTLDILAGLTEKDAGEVRVETSKQGPVTPGYVFQRPRLLNWRTVRQNLEYVLQAQRVSTSVWKDRIEEQLKLVGLNDFAGAFPLTLSGGMQQRTAIARALVIEPDLLLMDEPFSSLDELTARHLRTELLRIWAELRQTIIFVTHNALEAAYLADRIYIVGQRPASVIGELSVDVPRPRRADDPRLVEVQQKIIQVLESATIPEEEVA